MKKASNDSIVSWNKLATKAPTIFVAKYLEQEITALTGIVAEVKCKSDDVKMFFIGLPVTKPIFLFYSGNEKSLAECSEKLILGALNYEVVEIKTTNECRDFCKKWQKEMHQLLGLRSVQRAGY